MSSNSTWIPDEDAQTLLAERCWLQGAMISAIAYGVNVALYYMSFYLLTRDRNRADSRAKMRSSSLLLIYIAVSFLLSTIFIITLAGFTQMAFIDNRNYPGGPSTFEKDMFSIPIDQVANVAFIMSNWLDNALMIWRFKVIYQRCRVPMWIVMPFPCLVFAGSIAMGIMCLIQYSKTSPYETNSINYTLPYGVITLGLNIFLTIAIVLRVMHFRNNIVSAMGPHHGAQYTSIAAMVIESSAIFSATCIAFLVLFGIGNPLSEVFLQSLNQIQTIASLLIVFRVAQGKGWTKGTATYIMEPRGSEPTIQLARMEFGSQVGGSVTLTSFGEAGKGTGGRSQECLPISNNLVKDVAFSE